MNTRNDQRRFVPRGTQPSALFLRGKRLFYAAAVTVLVSLSSVVAAQLVGPSPKLSAAQAVEAQLAGLKMPNTPTEAAGLARVFAFASPGNRSQTGPLPRFAQMLKVGYPDMLNHRRATIESIAEDDGTALAEVRFETASGDVVYYVFILRQQASGSCIGCWMTEGVSERTGDRPAEIVT